MSKVLHSFNFKLIGKIPPGLKPGEYQAEFVELKVKQTKKSIDSILVVKLKKEQKCNDL